MKQGNCLKNGDLNFSLMEEKGRQLFILSSGSLQKWRDRLKLLMIQAVHMVVTTYKQSKVSTKGVN